MIRVKDRTFEGSVLHTPNERLKGYDRPTVTITTSEITVEEGLALFNDGVEWGIEAEDVYYDWSNFDVAGRVSNNRDGSISIVMGKCLSEDLVGIIDANVSTRKDMNAFADNVTKLRETLTDDIASTVIDIYPTLRYNETLIKAGTRIKYNGKLLRAAVDLWDVEENNPTNASVLWEEINYKEGYRIIPETITVGTAFAKDEYGWWNNTLYKSLLEANVYTPEAYPAGWELV